MPLQLHVEGNGRQIGGAQGENGRIEHLKAVALDAARQAFGETVHQGFFGEDQHLAVPARGRRHGLKIQRIEGAQVQNFDLAGEVPASRFGPMHAHAVGHNQRGIALAQLLGVGSLGHGGLAQWDGVAGGGLHGFGLFGTGHFAPVQALVFQHYHGVGVEKGGPHQAFHVGRVAGIHHFDAPDGKQRAFDGTGVVRPAAAIGPNRHPNKSRNREFAHGEVARFGKLLH